MSNLHTSKQKIANFCYWRYVDMRQHPLSALVFTNQSQGLTFSYNFAVSPKTTTSNVVSEAPLFCRQFLRKVVKNLYNLKAKHSENSTTVHHVLFHNFYTGQTVYATGLSHVIDLLTFNLHIRNVESLKIDGAKGSFDVLFRLGDVSNIF